MKRRCTALLLCACLCAGAVTPAFAAEEAQEASPYDVTWQELESRVLAGSPNALALDENIATLEALDYEKLEDRLRDQLNTLTDVQWASSMQTITVGDQTVPNPYYNTYNAGSAASAYDALREQFDALRDGDLQADNQDLIRQIRNGQDQIVGGSQALYLTILELEQTLADGERGMAAIDRALTELRLRQQLGQVSRQQVEELERTRADTASQLATLKSSISSCKSQLQTLLGLPPTGELTLAPLPQSDDWTEPDYDADLAAAKEASWTLRSAQVTLDDAEETWEDDRKADWKYEREMAKHTWAAAQATYAAATADFETAFKALYDAEANARQVWENKREETAYRQLQATIAQLQYDRGTISRNALLSAQDDLAAARSAQDAAWRELFSARNSYRRAVEKGIV